MRKATYATARGFPRSVWDAKGPDWQPYRAGGTCALHKSCDVTQSGADGHAGGGFPRCNETMPAGQPARSTAGPMVPFLPVSLAAQCALPCATGAGGGGEAPCAESLSSSRGTYHPCPQLARGPALEPDPGSGGAGAAKASLPPWDFIVVQSHSAEAPVKIARERMLGPAFDEFGLLAAAQNATLVAYHLRDISRRLWLPRSWID
jgi:hypothetical protein